MVQVNETAALLDRAVFNKIRIEEIEDMNKLMQREILTIKKDSKADYICKSGQEFSSLKIEADGLIDKMTVGSRLFGNTRSDYCILSTTPKRDNGTNLCCYTAAEYTDHLARLQKHLKDSYGIEADFSQAQLKELEINKTFKLEQDFQEYRRVIEVIMHNLPSQFQRYVKFEENTGKKNQLVKDLEPGTYYAKTGVNNKSDRYLMLKVYDKTRAVQNSITLTESYMRVELKLSGAEKIACDLGTNVFSELTDQKINDYFSEQMQKFIIQPVNDWKKRRDKLVIKLMKEKMEQDNLHWQVNTLLSLHDLRERYDCPVLLDVNELMPLVPQVISDRQRKYNVKRNFRSQAQKHAQMFCNNDDQKLEELLTKVASSVTSMTIHS